jgi:hypothetical protein
MARVIPVQVRTALRVDFDHTAGYGDQEASLAIVSIEGSWVCA